MLEEKIEIGKFMYDSIWFFLFFDDILVLENDLFFFLK